MTKKNRNHVAKAIKTVNNLSKEEIRSERILQEDYNIIIVSANKERSTVVMNKIEYQSKNNFHSDDDNIYQKLQRNPITSIQTNLNSSLNRIETEKKSCFHQFGRCIQRTTLHKLDLFELTNTVFKYDKKIRGWIFRRGLLRRQKSISFG